MAGAGGWRASPPVGKALVSHSSPHTALSPTHFSSSSSLTLPPPPLLLILSVSLKLHVFSCVLN